MSGNSMKIFRFTLILFYLFYTLLFGDLLIPENGKHINYIHVLFEWEQEPDAVAYQIEISSQVDFSNPDVSHIDSSLIYIEREKIEWQSTYFWRVAPIYENENSGEWIDTRTFSTGTTISNAETIIYNEILYSDGLTLFGAFYDYYSAIIEKNGNEIWNTGDSPIIFYNTDYYGQFYGCEYVSGQPDGNFYKGIKFSLDNEIVWDEPNDEFNHHEIIELSNGNFLGIVEVEQPGPVPIGEWTSTCNNFYPGLCDGIIPFFTWFGDKIVEWDKDTKEVVWEWNFFDYLSMEDYDIENGTWFDAFVATPQRYDWTHANALWFDEAESAVYISIRHLSRIVKIHYPSGEIIWSMGKNMPSGDVDFGMDLGFNFQHSLQFSDEGTILIFDNGNAVSKSRGLEIQVIEDHDDFSAQLIWEYSLPPELYSSFSGNIQKIDTGNYLITSIGESGTTLEISEDKNLIWKGKYHLSEPLGAVYRANRISGLYPIAFSVIAPKFIINTSSNHDPINFDDTSMSFILINEGELTETYHVLFTDYSELFSSDSMSFSLAPDQSQSFNFQYLGHSEIEDLNFNLTVTPEHRPDLVKSFCYPDCENILVFPGDTDNNGIVELNDILPVGIYFNETGVPRLSNSFLWKPHSVAGWDILPATYADANGDGIVDGRDVIGIGVNWSATHEISGKMYTLEMSEKLVRNEEYLSNFKQLYHALNGNGEPIQTIKAELEKLLNFETPDKKSILQNYPNPFNSTTVIRFSIPSSGNISINLYDLLGNKIATLIDKSFYFTGEHTIVIDFGYLSSGVYVSTLETESTTSYQKMVLIK